MNDDYSKQDMNRLFGLVSKKANITNLNVYDVEDLMVDVIIDALTAVRKHGGSLVALTVFTAATRLRYYEKANIRALREGNNYHLGEALGDGNQDDQFNGEELDGKVIFEKGPAAKVPNGLDELAIRDLTRQLPVGQQVAFTLCGEYEFTLNEASTMTGIPMSTLSRNLTKARRALQKAVLDY
jgi:DNA-directed RNA polymerase specialized sigma24 family protein